MRDDARVAGAAAVTVVLWASAFVAIRSAGGYFAPGALALGRLLVASLALGVVWRLSGGGWPARAAWPGILCSGLLWFGLYMVTLNWGERDVDAGTAAMLVNIGPILLAFGCFTGTAACLPFAGQFASQLGSAPVSATLQVVYLGLFPTTLGFTTWAYALARTTSGRMGATIYAVPTLVIIMSWLILGQVPRWLAVAGGVLCLAGVAVSRSRSRADQKASAQPAT